MNKLPSRRAAVVQHLRDFEWGAAQYQSGRSIKEVANDIGVPRAELFDYCSRMGISQGLNSQIATQRDRLLAERYAPEDGLMPTDTESIIAINATMQAALIREHRDDIRRMRKLCMHMLVELEHLSDYHDLFEDLGTILRAEDDRGNDRLNELYKKVIAIPERTASLKRLGETLAIVIKLEREAFGMGPTYEDDEIRRSKQVTPSARVFNDYDAITKKFMRVLGTISVTPEQDPSVITDVNSAGQTQAQPQS